MLIKNITRKIPGLSLKLHQARIADTPEYYVKKTLFSSVFFSVAIVMIIFGFTKKPAVIIAFPFIFIISFLYFIKYADNKIIGIRSKVNKEIVFAGRFLIIEISSGVPLYTAFSNMAKNYTHVGPYFSEIVEKVDFGTSLEDAINETILTTPSPELRKMLWQVLNSLKTGADVSHSLTVVLDQIVREQQILVKEYGRKLNPLAMFFMMIAIIIPSLGIVMLIVLATFMGFTLTMGVLMVLLTVLAFIQFMFLAMIKNSRPAVDI
ncbi:MAG: type II secretion system F family protein [Nanoarchaeota archaeon]